MKTFFLLFLTPFILFGCSDNVNSYTEQVPTTNTKQVLYKTAVLKTNFGDIEIELFHDQAPETAKNFDLLAQADKYDNTIFHRVINGFMIQGGDYEKFDGTGGKAFSGNTFDDEIVPTLSHVRGTVSMANRGPNTNGSQFFIVQEDSLFLDGGYSIFGRVIKGMDIVDAIAETKTDSRDKPLSEVKLLDVVLSSQL